MAGIPRFSVQIISDRGTEKVNFRLEPSVNVDYVEGKMRSGYGVVHGMLSYDKDNVEVVATLEAEQDYYFIKFQKLPQAPQQAESLPGPVNLQKILDRIPAAESNPFQNADAEELTLFQSVAAGLSTESRAQGIATTICEYREKAWREVFLVVEAPSGSGKSQLPFTIAKMNIPTVHVVLGPFDDVSCQKIYRTMKRPSLCIQKAVEHDKFKWADSASCSVGSLRSCKEQLAVVRAIFYLLGDPAEVVDNTTSSYTMGTLIAFVARRSPASLPVFFLDEAMAIKGGEKALRYLRNVFRAAGLLVVLMGTNSIAANLVGRRPPIGSRRNDEVPEWCHVITRLPPCTADSLAALGWTAKMQEGLRSRGESWQAFVDAVNSSLSTSNPWFLRTVIESVISITGVLDDQTVSADSPVPTFADFFDQLLCSAAERIWTAKEILNTVNGLRAQLRLFLNMYGSTDDDLLTNQLTRYVQKTSRVYVSHHFAIPTDVNYSMFRGTYLEKSGSFSLRMKNENRWDADAARFASCDSDPWLYLLLGKLKGIEPFRYNEHFLTTHAAFSTVDIDSEKHRLHTENVVAQSRVDDALEAMGVCALIAASRYDGVAGSMWSNFVLHLATHLVCNEDASVDKLKWNWDASMDMESMGSLVQEWVIPFLGPPNSSWPEVLLQTPEIRLGNVNRARNRERVDFTVQGVNGGLSFAGEFKNYEDSVDVSSLVGILQRVPKTSCFHLVVVSKLQQSYGIGSNNTRFQHLSRANFMKLVLVDRSKRSLSLTPVFAYELIPWDECRALILFVEEAVINSDQVLLTESSSSSAAPPLKKQKVA